MNSIVKISAAAFFLGFIIVMSFWSGTKAGRAQMEAPTASASAKLPIVQPMPPPPIPLSAPVQDLSYVRIDSDGRKIYPCADPAEICEHLWSIGCATGHLPSCRDTMSKLGEDVCLNLYVAKFAPEVHALGVRCN